MTPHDRRTFVRGASALAGFTAFGLASRAGAQTAPPLDVVKIVTGFPPGGTSDTLCRRIAEALKGTSYTKTALVENKPGAGGQIAVQSMKGAATDGSVILQTPASMLMIYPHIYKNLAYNAFTDLETVVWIGTQPNLLCCRPDYPYDTIPKLIAAAKAKPGTISYGSSGLGTSPSLTMELFKQRTGVDMTFISYRGAAAAAADVLAGHVPLCIANIDSLMGQVSAGKLKPVATTGATRSTVLPETPTFVEAGFPDLVVTSWSLWAVPTGTPAPIKEKIKVATERALGAPDVITSMKAGGFEPGTMSLAEVDAFIKAEHKRWGEVIRGAGIKPE